MFVNIVDKFDMTIVNYCIVVYVNVHVLFENLVNPAIIINNSSLVLEKVVCLYIGNITESEPESIFQIKYTFGTSHSILPINFVEHDLPRYFERSKSFAMVTF